MHARCKNCGIGIAEPWWDRHAGGYKCRHCGTITTREDIAAQVAQAAGSAPVVDQTLADEAQRALAATSPAVSVNDDTWQVSKIVDFVYGLVVGIVLLVAIAYLPSPGSKVDATLGTYLLLVAPGVIGGLSRAVIAWAFRDGSWGVWIRHGLVAAAGTYAAVLVGTVFLLA